MQACSMSVSSELFESILLFSVDKSMIDGEVILYMLMEWQIEVKCESEITNDSTWAKNWLVIQTKRFEVSISNIFGDGYELGFIGVEFETILPHKILNNLE